MKELEARELLAQGRAAEALAAVRRARRRAAGPALALVECDALVELLRPTEALAAVNRALRRPSSERDLAAGLRLRRARLLWESGHSGPARHELEKASRLATAPAVHGAIAEAQGLFAWRTQDLPAALAAFASAERLFGESGDAGAVARAKGAYAGVLRDMGRLEEALAVVDEAVRAADASGCAPVRARLRVERASHLAALGRWSEARAELPEDGGTRAGLVRGVLALAGGDLETARRAVETVRQALEPVSGPRRAAVELLLVASDVRLAAGDGEAALMHATEAVRLSVPLKDPEAACRSRVRSVHALLALGRRAEATAEARRARKIAPSGRADLSALAALALGRSLLQDHPKAAARAFAEARTVGGDRPGFAHAARLGLALAEGAGREHPEVQACVDGLEAWGDRRVLAYCLADIHSVHGPDRAAAEVAARDGSSASGAGVWGMREHPPVQRVPGEFISPGTNDPLIAAFTHAAEALLGEGAWAERWVAAAHALRPVVPWSRVALVGEARWELRGDLPAPRPLSPADLACDLAGHCREPMRVDLGEPAWRRHPTRVLHGLGTALLAPIEEGRVLYVDIREGQEPGPRTLELVAQLARLLACQGPPPEPAELEADDAVGFPGILGHCPPMRALFARMRRVARWDDTVHLLGETGTGKENVAHALHLASARAAGPYVAVNASSFGDDLFDSLMFGHVKGAFTGALGDSQGHVGAAEGGTLFLDEVTDLSPRVQAKLLRFLETKEYVRVGEARPRRADVRVITASNVALADRAARGLLRPDLVYRLDRVTLALPPLRERGDDVVLLARHFLRQATERAGLPVPLLGREVVDRLRRHVWPGNVRELQNEMGKLVMAAAPGPIRLEHLSPSLREGRPQPAACLRTAVRAFERDHIGEVLRQTGGNRSRAASLLGLSRQALVAKLGRLGIVSPTA